MSETTYLTDFIEALEDVRQHKAALSAMSHRMRHAADLIDNPSQWEQIIVNGQQERFGRRALDTERRFRIDGERMPDGKAIADALLGAMEAYRRAEQLYQLIPVRERGAVRFPSLWEA